MRRLIPVTAVVAVFLLPGAMVAQTGRPSPKEEKQERPRREYKPQAEVASKIEFGTVKETDPAVKKALDAKDLSGGRKLLGKEAAFHGTVVKVFTSEGNTVVVLNFDRNFRSAMTAALEPADYSKFPSMEGLTDKRVLVTGKMVEYQGRPEIELKKPEQIKLITK